jgi:mannose-6-phosphate isomerase
LTSKYVDVPELLRLLRYEPLRDPVRRPVPVADGVVTWPVPVAEFALHRVQLTAEVPQAELDRPGPRTVLCLAGEVRVEGGDESTVLRPGEAGFVPATTARLQFSGAGEVFVASVGVEK